MGLCPSFFLENALLRLSYTHTCRASYTDIHGSMQRPIFQLLRRRYIAEMYFALYIFPLSEGKDVSERACDHPPTSHPRRLTPPPAPALKLPVRHVCVVVSFFSNSLSSVVAVPHTSEPPFCAQVCICVQNPHFPRTKDFFLLHVASCAKSGLKGGTSNYPLI